MSKLKVYCYVEIGTGDKAFILANSGLEADEAIRTQTSLPIGPDSIICNKIVDLNDMMPPLILKCDILPF